MLKLALIKAEREPASTRALIVFASDEARLSITGWVREAVDRFGVRLMTVDRRPILELGGHVGSRSVVSKQPGPVPFFCLGQSMRIVRVGSCGTGSPVGARLGARCSPGRPTGRSAEALRGQTGDGVDLGGGQADVDGGQVLPEVLDAGRAGDR